jgi:hypothetical protein
MFFMLLLVSLLSGCAGKKVATGPVFFPPPPNEPHVQYLTGINDVRDLGGKEGENVMSVLLTGGDKEKKFRKLAKSYGIAARNNKLYVAEVGNGDVVIIDPVKATFEVPKGLLDDRGKLKLPVNLDADRNGNLYVADTGRNEIVVFDANGGYLKTFGKDVFTAEAKIVALAVYEDTLYALDAGTGVVRVVDLKTGQQVATFGRTEPGKSLASPVGIAVDDKGFIYVTNFGNNKVMKFDRDGNYLASIGGGIGDRYGNFVRPKGIAVDHAGRIYVVDAGFNLVQLFNEEYHMLTYIGTPGLPAGSLNMPAGIAVTKENLDLFKKYAAPGFEVENLIFVISQFGQEFDIPRISVYGLGHKVEPKDVDKSKAEPKDTDKNKVEPKDADKNKVEPPNVDKGTGNGQ